MTDSLQQGIVPFRGDEMIAVQDPDGTIFVLFARLCENLGLSRLAQVRRTQRHAVLSEGLATLNVHTEGGAQAVQCLRLDLLPLWLAGVQARRVKADIRDKLVQYQREAAFVLWEAFRPQLVVDDSAIDPTPDRTIVQLQQIADMGRAIIHMAEQQIELQRQQYTLTKRLDSAAFIVKDLQGQVGAVQVRLSVLEEKLQPAAYITDAQASEVSQAVKALAELLQSSGGGSYQAVFQELYRRFGVSSYKLIRQEQFSAVLTFLDDWRKTSG